MPDLAGSSAFGGLYLCCVLCIADRMMRDDEIARVQLTGVLAKRPVNQRSSTGGIIASRWYKR